MTDVIEQLDAAVKWWNADEVEEPDVRRLFIACRAEIVRLRDELHSLKEAVSECLPSGMSEAVFEAAFGDDLPAAESPDRRRRGGWL